MAAVFARDGLQRRRSLLNITTEAMNRLVELGHHPQFGARALKRVIEREVAQPIAAKLTALPPGTPMIANLDAKDDQFSLRLRELTPVARSVFWPEAIVQQRTASAQSAWTASVLDGAVAALDRIDGDLEGSAPSGKIELASLAPEHARYFFCREQLKKVERLLHAVERAKRMPRKPPGISRLPTARPTKVLVRQYFSGNPRFDRQREAISLRHDVAELEAESVTVPDSPMTALLRELALLEAISSKPIDDRPALLVFRACVAEDSSAMFRLAGNCVDCLAQVWGVSTTTLFKHQSAEEVLLAGIFGEPRGRIQACYLQGLNLRRLLPEGAHTILAQRTNGVMGLILMSLLPVASEGEAQDRAKELAGTIDTIDPETFGPAIQMTTENKMLTDFRTGLAIPATASAEEFRALLLSVLPLPPEVQEAVGRVLPAAGPATQ